MTFTTTVNYDTPSQFVYDTDKLEIVGSVVKLKKLVYLNEVLYCSYNNNTDVDRGTGVTTTAFGGASIASGLLDLKSTTSKYMRYETASMALQKGTIKFDYKPNYSGSPASTVHLMTQFQTLSSLNNALYLYHDSGSGSIVLSVYDSSGVLVGNTFFGNPGFSAGTTYKITLAYDLDIGASVLFVDDAQLGVASAHTTTRTAVGILHIGANAFAGSSANAEYDNLLVLDNYNITPTSGEIPNYSLDDPTIQMASSISADGFTEISNVVSNISVGNELTYIMIIDGVRYYHDGASWVVSDGSYAQSNTISEINTNASTIISSGVRGKLEVVFHNTEGIDNGMELTSLDLTYDPFEFIVTPGHSHVSGYVLESTEGSLNVPVQNAVVRIFSEKPLLINGNLQRIDIITTTDSTGYWEEQVPETASIGEKLIYIIHFTDSRGNSVHKEGEIIVPDNQSVDLNDIAA